MKPTATYTSGETYNLEFNGRSFTIVYIHNSMEWDCKNGILNLDEMVTLGELFYNKFETPRVGNNTVPEGVTKGHKIKKETIREVIRDFSSGQNCVEIQQWKDIPEGLETLIDKLPTYVKDLLRTKYTDPNVMPYDFGFTED